MFRPSPFPPEPGNDSPKAMKTMVNGHTDGRASPAPSAGDKRKRSPSDDGQPRFTVPKHLKTEASKASHSVSNINYRVKTSPESIPLLTGEEVPTIAHAVLKQLEEGIKLHGSLAANLGVAPRAMILAEGVNKMFQDQDSIKIVERRRGAESTVTFVEVAEFIKAHPRQYKEIKLADGARVYEVPVGSCVVQLSESQWTLATSVNIQLSREAVAEDALQEELTHDIVSEGLRSLIANYDRVSAFARVIQRQLAETRFALARARRKESRASNSSAVPDVSSGDEEPHSSGPAGFTAVNASGLDHHPPLKHVPGSMLPSPPAANHPSTADGTKQQEAAEAAAWDVLKADLKRRFRTTAEFVAEKNRPSSSWSAYERLSDTPSVPPLTKQTPSHHHRRSTTQAERPNSSSIKDYGTTTTSHHGDTRRSTDRSAPDHPHPRAQTPAKNLGLTSYPYGSGGGSGGSGAIPLSSSAHPHTTPKKPEGKYHELMTSYVKLLDAGDKIEPRCDRCRKIGKECSKKLTACWPCTNKHARCSWNDVRDEEVGEVGRVLAGVEAGGEHEDADAAAAGAGVGAGGLDEMATSADSASLHERKSSEGSAARLWAREGTDDSAAADLEDEMGRRKAGKLLLKLGGIDVGDEDPGVDRLRDGMARPRGGADVDAVGDVVGDVVAGG